MKTQIALDTALQQSEGGVFLSSTIDINEDNIEVGNGQPLRRRAAASVGWSLVRFGGDQFFNFIIFVVLARLLTPTEFGVFIVAMVVADVGKIVAQAGLVSSLFRVPKLTEDLADTVFWSNLALGFLIALVVLILRQPLAALLGSRDAASIIGTIGFTVPIAALGASHMSRNLRAFGHKSLALRSVLAGLIGGTLAMAAAWYGFGVWALVVQRFTLEIINTAVAWRAFRWRPGLRFSWTLLRQQLGIGSSLALSQLLQLALARSQDVILARMVGLWAVGTYRTAGKTNDLITQGAIAPFSMVALPALSKLQYDLKAFERGYLKIVGSSALLSFPAIVGAGALADQIIPLVFGAKWQASIPVAQILSLLVLPVALNAFCDPAMQVLRQTRSFILLSIAQVSGTLVFCIAAAPFGLVAFAAAYVARAYLTMLLQLWLFRRAAGIRIRAILACVLPQLLAASIMAVAVLIAGRALPMGGDHLAARVGRLAMCITIGATVYGGALAVLLGSERRRELIQELKSLGHRQRPSTA